MKLGIPRIVFHGPGIFSLCVHDSLELHNNFRDGNSFFVQDIPDVIKMKRHEVPLLFDAYTILKMVSHAEEKSYGVIVNSFYELEPAYAELYRRRRRAWYVVTIADQKKRSSEQKRREARSSSHRDGGEVIFERRTAGIERSVGDPRDRSIAELEELVDDSTVGMEVGYNDPTEEIRSRVTVSDIDPTVHNEDDVVHNEDDVEYRRAEKGDDLELSVGDLTVQRDREVEDQTVGEGSGREHRERLVSSRLTGYLWSINREEVSGKREKKEEKELGL